jgi:hypothetical protein
VSVKPATRTLVAILLTAAGLVSFALVLRWLWQWGLTLREATGALAAIVGASLLVAGVLALFFRGFHALGTDADTVRFTFTEKYAVQCPVLVLPMVLGAILMAFAVWKAPDTPTKLSVSGTILLRERQPLSGITVGVLTSSHLTQTGPDGTYHLSFPREERGTSYQAVVYVGNLQNLDIAVFNFDADGNGRFDDVLIKE